MRKPLTLTLSLLVLFFTGCVEENTGKDVYDTGGGRIAEEDVNKEATADSESAAFADWDADANGTIEEEELTDAFTEAGLYDEWNADASDQLDDNEFSQGLFESLDLDDNGVIEENEFTERVNLFWDDAYEHSFADWDLDGSGTIEAEEFRNSFSDYGTGLWEAWNTDGDGLLTEDELLSGIYDAWDADSSGLIEENEYRPYAGLWSAP